MVENVGVAVGIPSPSVSVQKLVPLPVSASDSVADIMCSRCRLMSENVGSVIFGLGMVENVGFAVGIASLSVSVQKLFPLPVSTSGFVADI